MIPLGIQNFAAYNKPIQYNVGVPYEYIRIRNESDNECLVTFTGSGSSPLAAWVQDDFYVGQSFTGQITVTALPTANNTILQAGFVNGTAYAKGELKTPVSIMLTRIISLNQNQTLSNEGQPAGTIVIDVGTGANAQMSEIWNDHFIFRVQDASTNVQHQVLFGNPGGTPDYLQLGQAGDEILVNGAMKVVQASHLDNGTLNTDGTGAIVLNNNKALRSNNNASTIRTILYMDNSNQTNLVAGDADIIQLQDHNFVNLLKLTETLGTFIGQVLIPNSLGYQVKDNGGTARTVIWMDASNNTVIAVGGSGAHITFTDVLNATLGTWDTTTGLNVVTHNLIASDTTAGNGQLNIAGKKINDNSGNNILDASATGLFLKAITNGAFNFQGDRSHTDFTITAISTGSGAAINGAAAITHNLKALGVGIAPTIVVITPSQLPTLFFVDTIGTSTFTIHATGAFNFNFCAARFA